MDITFTCNDCGQELEIDEAGAGLVVQCPKCNRNITVPAPKSQLSATIRISPFPGLPPTSQKPVHSPAAMGKPAPEAEKRLVNKPPASGAKSAPLPNLPPQDPSLREMAKIASVVAWIAALMTVLLAIFVGKSLLAHAPGLGIVCGMGILSLGGCVCLSLMVAAKMAAAVSRLEEHARVSRQLLEQYGNERG